MFGSVSPKVLLEWTGHPLVDVGIATLCAMVGKNSPHELTLEDLDKAADEMADYYFSGIMTSYNSCVFTMNAYDNPSFSAKSKREYENKVLRAHRFAGEVPSEAYRCVFSGQPATHFIERRQMPLLTGEDVINFYPEGRKALSVSGPYLVALQALPLGGRRVEGKLLVAHADLPEVTLAFARHYLRDNRRLIGLAKAGCLPERDGPSPALDREHGAWDSGKKRPKYPDAKGAKTLITADLNEILRIRSAEFAHQFVSITVYWLSNSGQGPSLNIFHIPAQITRFLSIVSQAPLGEHWSKVVAKGWLAPMAKEDSDTIDKSMKTKKVESVSAGPGRSRNSVLSDLFAVYENGFLDADAAALFIKKHLLRKPVRFLQIIGENTTETGNKLLDGLVNWPLTKIFLKEVMGVDERYIEKVRLFSDRLADHISSKNDKNLFRGIVFAEKPWEMRRALTKAQRNQARDHNNLLFGLQEYLDIFEAEHVVARFDWSLVRDLISIRIVEKLFNSGFFNQEDNRELLENSQEETG